LHGDPAQPNADVFLRVPGGYRLPAHSHSSAERMILVSGELKVRYQGAPPATLTPGAYAFGPAKRPHDGSCAGQQPCTLFIAFEGPVDAVAFQGPMD
jgi:quercetin dioxygenase-like cupin family protein